MLQVPGTFLHIRMLRNPKHYGLAVGASRAAVDAHLVGVAASHLWSLATTRAVLLRRSPPGEADADDGAAARAAAFLPESAAELRVEMGGGGGDRITFEATTFGRIIARHYLK